MKFSIAEILARAFACNPRRLLTVSASAALATVTLTSHAQQPAGGTQLPITVPPPPPLNWQQCPEGPERECALLTVPLNYADLSQGFVELPVSRARANGQSRGVLVINFGGPVTPSGSGVRFRTDAELGTLLTPELVDEFDIVGFNARGTTDGIVCFNSDTQKEYWQTNHFSRSTAEHEHLLGLERAANQRCLADNAPLVRHVDTASGVRDMEQLRRAMGVEQFSFVGLSYGTVFGVRYAVLYPGRIKAMLLDAVVDRSVSDIESWPDRISVLEDGWEEFKQWCEDRPSCRLRGQDIDAVFAQVMARARNPGIPAPLNPLEPDRLVNDWELTLALQATIEPGITYPWTEEILVKATENDASLAGLIYDNATGAVGDGTYFPGGTFRAITCIDTRWSQFVPNRAAARGWVVSSQHISPHFGEGGFVQAPQQCHGYPIAPVEAPPVNSQVSAGQPAFLVVGGTQDRSTPHKWAEHIASQIPNSRLITRVGHGHVSMDKSRCVKQAMSDYFVRSILPANGLQCPTDPDLYPPDLPPPNLGGSSFATQQHDRGFDLAVEAARRLVR